MVEKHLLPIGTTIQEIRKNKKMTLGILSEKSGVSKAMLSQIESNKVNPTVATVWKIATGLGVDINELTRVISITKRNFTLTKKDEILGLECDQEGVHLRTLTPVTMIDDLEMYLITFDPESELKSLPHFPGTEEFLTLLEGQLTVKAGKSDTAMQKGDFLAYHSDIDHSIKNTGKSKALLHMVVRYKKLTDR
ncbi:MAG: XRE family transcriptional regulator [Spirochaetia bacterium]|jgi:transcriptional regulator with XRE-family HTH domain|nr:XRE family transcriptional regulator [Spirochaetia bacterium]